MKRPIIISCFKLYCLILDPCMSNPCQNGGSCIVRPDTLERFSCSCADGYGGKKCETGNNYTYKYINNTLLHFSSFTLHSTYHGIIIVRIKIFAVILELGKSLLHQMESFDQL